MVRNVGYESRFFLPVFIKTRLNNFKSILNSREQFEVFHCEIIFIVIFTNGFKCIYIICCIDGQGFSAEHVRCFYSMSRKIKNKSFYKNQTNLNYICVEQKKKNATRHKNINLFEVVFSFFHNIHFDLPLNVRNISLLLRQIKFTALEKQRTLCILVEEN